jgi:hypothetical protein
MSQKPDIGTKDRGTGPVATTAAKPRKAPLKPDDGGVVLLSGGNPQIAKGYGDGPVQAYIAAMPGWKRNVGRRLDDLIVRTVADEGQGWFLAFRCMTKYIKVTFFRGASLHPVPPVGSKMKNVRYLHIFEDGAFDEARLADWVTQASRLPGERL